MGRMDDEVVRLRHREALLDKSQAGPLLATIHQLRADKDNLLQRNQLLQMAAATQSPDELAKAKAATIAAKERAADAEQQLNTAQEPVAHLTARDTELQNQNQLLESQAQADQTLQQRLATAESQVQQLQGQVLSLNQQLLAMTQQSHHYLQEIMRMRTTAAPATTTPPMVGGLPVKGGSALANTSPVFAGSGVTLGMFAPPQATLPAGVPGYVGGQVHSAPQPAPAATTAGLGGGVVTTSVITPSRGTMGDGSMGHGQAQQ